MPLTPGESDRLLLHLEASLAQRRRDRGLRLNVPEATLRYWRKTGGGPKSARIGRRVMYRVEDIDAWVAAQFAKQQSRG